MAAVIGFPATNANEVPAYTVAIAFPCLPGSASDAATGATTAQKTPWVAAHSILDSTSIGYPTDTAESSCEKASAATVMTTTRRRGQSRTNLINGMVMTATPYA
ncbi:hypothetical protein VF34_02805 [Rhodococcus sp. PML026]|nr:hypothetical protein VF34_02805 [Rhodococcus sp. PML026]